MELKLVRDGGTLTRLPVARSWGQWVTPGALDGLERQLVGLQELHEGQHQFPPWRSSKTTGTWSWAACSERPRLSRARSG